MTDDFAARARTIKQLMDRELNVICGRFHPECGCICILEEGHPPGRSTQAPCRHNNTMPCSGIETLAAGQFDIIHKAQHYNSHPSGVEAIEICRHLSGDWFNAFKYVFRSDHKNGRQDIEKALYYAEDGVVHQRIPMRLPSWTSYETALLNGIMDFEPDSTKRTFYNAIQQQSASGAATCVKYMLDNWRVQ